MDASRAANGHTTWSRRTDASDERANPWPKDGGENTGSRILMNILEYLKKMRVDYSSEMISEES